MKKRITATAITAVFFLLTGMRVLTAAQYYVSPDGNDANSGTSWDQAKATIQVAVEAAGNNGTVLVTNGVYDVGNHANNRVMITNSVTLRSVERHGAIIRGAGSDKYNTSEAVRCVYMNSGMLDGFILEDGATFESSTWSRGGGALAINSPSIEAINCVIRNSQAYRGGGVYYGTLRDCVISNNVAEYEGGGNDNGTRYNCLIRNNRAYNGGGGKFGYYYNCTIRDNIATGLGGGVFSYPGYGYYLEDCVVENNTAGGYGGGVYNITLRRCSVRNNNSGGNGGGGALGTYTDCLIESNTATGSGGGVYDATLHRCEVLANTQQGSGHGGGMAGGSAYSSLFAGNSARSAGGTRGVDLYSCTVVNNTALVENGSGIHYDGEIIYNTLAYNNTGGLNLDLCNLTAGSTVSNTLVGTASLVHPGVEIVPAGSQLFIDPSRGDFSLHPSATAIDAGSNALNPTNNTLDVVGVMRICFGSIDIGAYEFGNLYVSPQGDDNNSGRSWERSKQTIQAAVDAAESTMTVLVSNGVYNSGTHATPVSGSTLNRLVITNAVTVKSLSGAERTVIQGEGAYNQAGATRCVFMSAGVLDGFTLEKGVVRSTDPQYYEYERGGGGICIMKPDPGTTVKNCVVRNNRASTGGGISGGQAGSIGHYSAYVNNAIVVDCVITNNTAGYGGGIAYYATFDRCVIAHNTASQGGGAYDMKKCVNNSLFCYNTASSGNAGGVYLGNLSNCTVTENTEGGVKGSSSSWNATYLNNCIIWGNESYEITQDDLITSVNVCTSDPLFRDAIGSDYRLAADSPCIDAGDNTKSVGSLDLSGRNRIAFGTVDIGAYEFPESVRVTFDVSPGIFKESGSELMQVLVPSLNENYGSCLPTNAVYFSLHAPVKWSSQPGGAGTEINAESELLSLDEHTVYLQWKMVGLILLIQ